ncbi:hypothetical protein NDU88_010479 [Pleurodeles waltl]|uniref:Uncharacterized protein n=1 Tax=Pleurodeles waltl TaxID=8319 RepID=A0AAV7PYH9_PLEWA|nr:hypothetical protein NDU88_010479 [Pleurodeles waltl]
MRGWALGGDMGDRGAAHDPKQNVAGRHGYCGSTGGLRDRPSPPCCEILLRLAGMYQRPSWRNPTRPKVPIRVGSKEGELR